ncbi:hypothetical protein, partial [Streptomyces sp. NPDC048845]|uniref:hypothetical protein n=1 Tax=Streptomyces sp. NPDC048845 TaxID=3155390 RepID=UPI00342267EC
RGCHWREDHPDRDDSGWRRHLVVRLGRTTGPGAELVINPTDTADFPPARPHGTPHHRSTPEGTSS